MELTTVGMYNLSVETTYYSYLGALWPPGVHPVSVALCNTQKTQTSHLVVKRRLKENKRASTVSNMKLVLSAHNVWPFEVSISRPWAMRAKSLLGIAEYKGPLPVWGSEMPSSRPFLTRYSVSNAYFTLPSKSCDQTTEAPWGESSEARNRGIDFI